MLQYDFDPLVSQASGEDAPFFFIIFSNLLIMEYKVMNEKPKV